MRDISCHVIRDTIQEMCIQATHFLSDDMVEAMNHAIETEESTLGKQVLKQLEDNLKIAGEEMIPICQDTGMAIFFIEMGQEIHIVDGILEEAINEGVRRGYTEGFLRKSVVEDPIYRKIQMIIHRRSFIIRLFREILLKSLWHQRDSEAKI